MTHNELMNLLQSDNPDTGKKALQHIKMLIDKGENLTDEILILMLQSNLEFVYNAALKYIIRKKQGSLMSNLYIPAQMEKDEVFDHALFALWTYVRKHDFDTSKEASIERFLRVVCKRHTSKYLTKNSRNGDTNIDTMPEPSDDSLPPIYDADAYEVIQRLFGSLGKGCKEILTLRYYKDRKFKGIADEVDSSEGSVKVTLYRCIDKLKKQIAENDTLAKYIRELLSN